VKTSTFNYPFSTPIFGAEFQGYVTNALHGKSFAKHDHLTVEAVSKNFSILALMCSTALAMLRLSNAQSPSDTKHAEYNPLFDGCTMQLGVTC
jgi:hypothetical protein